MIGVARTSAAITIVNALSSGVGSAVGIDLHVEARVEVREVRSEKDAVSRFTPEPPSALVRETLRRAIAQYFPTHAVAADLHLTSEIPVARGLKSSSAVTTAVLFAVARAAGHPPTSLEVARLAAAIGRDTGVSATGALDDAIASLEVGRFVTDNQHDEILRHDVPEVGLGVALYVPSEQHAPAPNYRASMDRERSAGETAARAALGGDWPLAMQLNTELVERAIGYSYEGVRDRLRAHGAIASGVSGLGPTLAAVARFDDLEHVAGAFADDGTQRMTVGFTRLGVREGADS